MNYIDVSQVRAEMDARYTSRNPRRRVRNDSSLEITRRLMVRRSRQELKPGRAQGAW